MDRFSGSIAIGGPVSRQAMAEIFKIAEKIIEYEDDLLDGVGYFSECNSTGFEELIAYCKTNAIPLKIQWDAKYEFDGTVEYFIDGEHKYYTAFNHGEVAVAIGDLIENKFMSVADYIESLGIPNFPDFEIAE